MDSKIFRRLSFFIIPMVIAALLFGYVPGANAMLGNAAVAVAKLNMPLEAVKSKTESKTEGKGENENENENENKVNIAPKDDNNNTTTSGNVSDKSPDAVQASKRFESGALLKTPDDIVVLQQKARETIESETIVGKTTEAPYKGGGTIVEQGGLKVQSKIPDDFYKLDVPNLLSMKADLSISDKSKPTVLIYHSHTTEAYQTLDVGYYTTSFHQRRDDISQNMVRVGDEIAAALENAGFKVIHDREIYDKNYSAAYSLSDVSVKKYLEENPSIDVTIDVHRDAIEFKDKTKVKPTVDMGGKKAAQIMIIAGCEYGDIKNFPDWEYNLRFALQLQKKAEEMYPGLMRPVLFSARRYNLFETHNSILLEMGSDGNTLEEACYSGRLIGTALGEMLGVYVEK